MIDLAIIAAIIGAVLLVISNAGFQSARSAKSYDDTTVWHGPLGVLGLGLVLVAWIGFAVVTW